MNTTTAEKSRGAKASHHPMTDFRELLEQGCFTKEMVGLNSIGLENFSLTGFPQRKDELFSYVDVSEMAASKLQLRQEPSNTTLEMVEKLVFPSAQKSVIVFVDGLYMEHLSDISAIRSQVEVSSLGEAFNLNPSLKDELLDHGIDEKDPFANLNAAFALNGAYISVKEGQSLQTPIEILFYAADFQRSTLLASPRAFIELGKGSSAEIIIKHSRENTSYLGSAVVDVKALAGAEAKIYQVAMQGGPGWRFMKINVDQSAESKLELVVVSTGSKIARTSYDWRLNEPGASMEIKSLAALDGSSQNHCHAKVTHHAPDCSSKLLFKNIVNEAARSSVDSTVIVDKGASGSFSHQLVNNLLLSDNARADNKPNLMINADDVQCSHGATISQLDEEILFYLGSRGVSRAQAVKSLTMGFAREVSNNFLDGYVKAMVEHSLARNLGETS